jgi:hypothetical protein
MSRRSRQGYGRAVCRCGRERKGRSPRGCEAPPGSIGLCRRLGELGGRLCRRLRKCIGRSRCARIRQCWRECSGRRSRKRIGRRTRAGASIGIALRGCSRERISSCACPGRRPGEGISRSARPGISAHLSGRSRVRAGGRAC